jgi:hypothetical protein
MVCYTDLSIGWSVEEIYFPFDPIDFYRDYVATSKPVIIKGFLCVAHTCGVDFPSRELL